HPHITTPHRQPPAADPPPPRHQAPPPPPPRPLRSPELLAGGLRTKGTREPGPGGPRAGDLRSRRLPEPAHAVHHPPRRPVPTPGSIPACRDNYPVGAGAG